MEKLKVAVLGCGNIFPVHADIITASNKAELIAVVDIDENKAKKAAGKYNCLYYTDYQDLLKEDLDLVHICTPHYQHSAMAIDFMEAGLDVLVEKPVALNSERAEKMIETAKNTSRRLGVVFQNRFNENNLKAKEILESAKLGKIKAIKAIVTWHRDEEYYQQDDWRGEFATEGGGVLINQAIHTLDLMQWFVGEIEAVKGNVDNRCIHSIEVEDTAEGTIFFENEVRGIFYASNCFTVNSPIQIEIDCERGRMILEGGNLKIDSNVFDDQYVDRNNTKYKSYWGYGHKTLIEGFYKDVIENTNDFTISAEDGIKCLRLIEAIYESSKSASLVEIRK
ncbi:Gfo/Idh/MocA family protein [Natronospora cellulosivora (SeqCode)]